MTHVAGIDRWRGGWVVAEHAGSSLSIWTAETIDDATTPLAACDAVAIDMPIALCVNGTRPAEAEARSVLGASARSVFTSPTRAGVEALTQSDATSINRAHGGPGISAQAFGLFASIRELRAALIGPRFNHWWETHPETAFALMNDATPLASKRTAQGVAQRLQHLRGHFCDLDQILLDAPPKVPIDDVLDAIAAVWSAQRIVSGDAVLFGLSGRDDQGFAEGIRA